MNREEARLALDIALCPRCRVYGRGAPFTALCTEHQQKLVQLLPDPCGDPACTACYTREVRDHA